MNDRISLVDLELMTPIGVPDAERAAPQRILATVEIQCDVSHVAKTDDLKGAIDYAVIAQEIRTLAKTPRKTLERLTEDIAQCVLRHKNALGVTVTTKKFILTDAKEVSMTIERRAS